MFRYAKHCNRIFPRQRAGLYGRLAPAGPVDSYRRAHRMLCHVPPRKGGTFCFSGLVVDAIAPMRASRPALTFSDRHDQQRDVASASGIRQGRSRFRARRRRLADRNQRRALSRFHLRRRGECARPLPSASGRGVAGAGDKAVAHVEPVQEPGRRQARGAAVRAELCRFRVLLPIPAPRRWNAPSR